MADVLMASDPETLERAAAVIRRGGVVAMPTETFYGLAADATHDVATERIFEIKGRPATMALPIVAASLEQVASRLGPLDETTARAAKACWPAPLSLVVAWTPQLSTAVGQPDARRADGAGRTVAVRVPDHAFVRALCEHTGTLLTSTSANLTGEPPAATAEAVASALGDRVDLIVDGGPAPGGLPSTIADLRDGEPRLLRDGAVPWERVLESIR